MKLAIIGSGISGLTVAHHLHPLHEITVFEAADHPGGHTWTPRVEAFGREWAVDTGFVVFNEETYPNLLRLFREIGVSWKPSDMSFSVRDDRSGLEYCGTSLATLFAQPGNLFRPAFWGMLRDIVRFNREAKTLLADDAVEMPTLGKFLDRGGYGRLFVENYLVPMGGSVWSTAPREMLDFPAEFLLRFFDNHRFLTADGHFTWQVVEGGSSAYLEALMAPFRNRVRLETPVVAVERTGTGSVAAALGKPGGARSVGASTTDAPDHSVRVTFQGPDGLQTSEHFDAVVFACHADQALGMIADPTDTEREILSAFPYSESEVVLHTDRSLLPRARRARASWNAHVPAGDPEEVRVTYDMSRLMGLDSPEPFLVTLNRTEVIDPEKVLLRFRTGHPTFTAEGEAAQRRYFEIGDRDRYHFCGAYWRYGFHEDGVWSGLRVARALGAEVAIVPAPGDDLRLIARTADEVAADE